jgi:SAM-dependent methyltransferase
MHSELLDLLACTHCGGALSADQQSAGSEIHEGALRCGRCGASIPIKAGIPRAVRAVPHQARVASSFSFQWKAYNRGSFERTTVYGRTEADQWQMILEATGIDESAMQELVVLDAGCGPANVSRQIARHGARAVVALDVSDSIDALGEHDETPANVHPIQADLFSAPLRASFDLVWSMGVIHHTNDARGAFRALTRYVRPGGTLFVWVYPRDPRPFHWANLIQWLSALLTRIGVRRLSDSAVFVLAGALSYPTATLHRAYRAIRRIPALRPRTDNACDGVKPMSRRTFHLIWNDALLAPYTSCHREREVIGWFRAAGFTDVVTSSIRPLGVRGRAPIC